MEIKFNIDKSERKALAQKIADIIGAEVEYLGVPSCAYQIDIFTLSKDAVLSFSDRSDTEIVEKVLDGLAEAGYSGETDTPPEGAESAADTVEDYVEIDVTIISDTEDEPTNEPKDKPENITALPEPLTAEISFPLEQHTVQSLTNLICMIHSRGALLSKATGGNFSASKELVEAIAKNDMADVPGMIAFLQGWGSTNVPLTGITFADDKLIFDGFGAATDAEAVQAFMNLAVAMNRMAITQKRVQAKDVDDSNEKYSMRVWLVRIGFGGADHKTDRRILLEHLTGHTAFRNDEERAKWTERQKAKREAAKAAVQTTEEEENDAVSE